ncbi:DUF4236 domain-containing protein [Pengzhenrongella sp.]|jgi:hypothetical protein|uniref:DUF4236 domain-containing protein n=1 Tax=Pengzhenrongella sp. TaxID=2888820 RepID=UPI002F92D1EE
MGFYVRKSLKAGPFRFNLSSSGLGVSAGVPGFRVGTGPRGNYVHMGRGGVYYRATLGGRPSTQPAVRPAQPATGNEGFAPTDIVMVATTGSTVHDLAPTDADDLVTQLNEAAGRRRLFWPTILIALVLGSVLAHGWVIWLLAVPVVWWVRLRDGARTSVVTFYDINDQDEVWFDALVQAAATAGQAAGLWRRTASGQVTGTRGFKANAGASSLIQRSKLQVDARGARGLVSNIAIPSLRAERHTLYLLPDRVLLEEGRRFTQVSYQALDVSSATTRFIEEPAERPRDGEQVGQTWRYVNVKGGPDRRYATNPVLPVMLYGELTLSTTAGLRWEIQSSQRPTLEQLARLLADPRTRTRPGH